MYTHKCTVLSPISYLPKRKLLCYTPGRFQPDILPLYTFNILFSRPARMPPPIPHLMRYDFYCLFSFPLSLSHVVEIDWVTQCGGLTTQYFILLLLFLLFALLSVLYYFLYLIDSLLKKYLRWLQIEWGYTSLGFEVLRLGSFIETWLSASFPSWLSHSRSQQISVKSKFRIHLK